MRWWSLLSWVLFVVSFFFRRMLSWLQSVGPKRSFTVYIKGAWVGRKGRKRKSFFIFGPYLNMEWKSATHHVRFLRLLANWKYSNVQQFWILNFLQTNCCKLALECKWIRTISQIRTQNVFYWKKKWFFFKIGNGGKFAVGCVPNTIIF